MVLKELETKIMIGKKEVSVVQQIERNGGPFVIKSVARLGDHIAEQRATLGASDGKDAITGKPAEELRAIIQNILKSEAQQVAESVAHVDEMHSALEAI